MNKHTITIGNQEIAFSGLLFSKWFGISFVAVMILVAMASIKVMLG